MVKTLRVDEDTYEMVMDLVGRMQMQKRRRVSVDTALKEIVSKKLAKKDQRAWENLEKLMFKGPKTNCVEEIDLLQ